MRVLSSHVTSVNFFFAIFICQFVRCVVATCVTLQHQQQVATAVERAKQVTMTELNAVIGVNI